MANDSSYLVVAAITSALGIKGWLNVKSFSDPQDNVLRYKKIYVGQDNQWRAAEVEAARPHGKGFAIKLRGCEDRNEAELYRHHLIAIDKADLPTLEEGEYYWHQLVGLRVVVQSTGQLLGKVNHLLETGSNDVLVVQACEQSIDQQERLLPYRPETVLAVDLAEATMYVDWDADF